MTLTLTFHTADDDRTRVSSKDTATKFECTTSKLVYTPTGSIEFSQRALIDSIIKDAHLSDAKVKPVPAKVSVQLHACKDESPFALDFNYRSIVGKLNYLAQTTRPDVAYATHQIAKYSADPRQSHGETI